MAEGQASGAPNPAEAEMAPELDPKEFEQLVEMVYKLLRDQMLLELERRGASSKRYGR